MDKLKINIKLDNNNSNTFEIAEASIHNNIMEVRNTINSFYGINAGDYIQFSKKVVDGADFVLKESFIYPVLSSKTSENLYSLSILVPEERNINIVSYERVYGATGTFYTFTLTENHGFYPQDYQVITNLIANGKIISGFTCDLTVLNTNNLSDEYIVYKDIDVSLSMESGEPILSGTTLLAEIVGGQECVLSGVSTNKISIQASKILPIIYNQDNKIVSIKFNPNRFFIRDVQDNECFFYSLNQKVDVLFNKVNPWRSVPIVLTDGSSYSDLEKESILNEKYTINVEENIIPGFIDMERVRYKPIIKGTSIDVNEIEFIPHFRQRVLNGSGWPNAEVGFADIWYVDSGKTWNASVSRVSSNMYYADHDSVDYFNADLIGELDFTDDDILYQKSKLKKTFLRISLYTDTNPLTQKLLYYSTVFIDSNRLYSNYVKLCANNKALSLKEGNNIPFTRYSANTLSDDEELRCNFIIHNEYDTTRSSDGFYQYLFADDAPSESEDKTIYMKIEFNHAGNDRTIPLIPWIGNRGLTIENYLEMLYIPIKISYINKEYVYWFDSDRVSINQTEKPGKIKIALFEPLFSSNGS